MLPAMGAQAQLRQSTTASTYNIMYQLFSVPSTANTVKQEPQMINAQEPQMRTLDYSGSIYSQEPQMIKFNTVYQEPQM